MALRAAALAAGLVSLFAACSSATRHDPLKLPAPAAAGAGLASLPSSAVGLDPRFFDPIIAEEGPLPRRNPDPRSIDTAGLLELLAQAEAQGSDAVVIAEHGTIVAERYFSSSLRAHTVQSVTKSIVSLGVGKLLEQGRIATIDSPLADWFPEWARGTKAEVTLRHLLTHTSGLRDEGDELFSPDIADKLAYARARPLENRAGNTFAYSNVGVMLLSGVIEQAAGMPVDRYLAGAFFEPLGISDFDWEKDASGHVMTPGGLLLRPVDLLRLGILVTQAGSWQQRQLIAGSWLTASASEQLPFFPCYGYLWWLVRPGCGEDGPNGDAFGPIAGFRATGWGGNYVVAVPSAAIVAVRTKAPLPGETLAEEQETAFAEFPERVTALALLPARSDTTSSRAQ